MRWAAGDDLHAAITENDSPDSPDLPDWWIGKAWCVFGGLWRRRKNASDHAAVALAEQDGRDFIQELDRLGRIALKDPLRHDNFISESGELRDALVELIRLEKA
jgi:hypothetical protein